jgi:hypothetical protein
MLIWILDSTVWIPSERQTVPNEMITPEAVHVQNLAVLSYYIRRQQHEFATLSNIQKPEGKFSNI